MKAISQTQFSNANANTPGQQLIIALWCELFNMDTIDSYRVRLMNANSILAELYQAISDRVSDDISLNNILFICREAERIISTDGICSKYFPNQKNYLIHILKEVQKTKKDDDLVNLTFKIKTLSSHLVTNYKHLLTLELKNSIDSNDLISIQYFTKALGSELVYNGFSFEYLYFLKKVFLNDQHNKSFNDRWSEFVDLVLADKNIYDIHFKFSAKNTLSQYNTIFDISISENFYKNSTTPMEDDFIDQPWEYFGTIRNLKSYDSKSAISDAIKKIDMLRNISRYEFRKADFSISQYFLVVDARSNVSEFISSYLRPVGFVQYGNKWRFENYITNVNNSLSTSNLDDYSKERISNSFKYFRMSLDAEESEIRFILCWIALEFLLKTGSHSSIISRILYFLPKVISSQYFKKILVDFSANISRLHIPASITNTYFNKDEHNQFEIKSIYEFLKDSTKVNAFISNIQNELLKIRINELANQFSSNEQLSQRFHRHIEDLEWNIQRIYRVRNKLVHSAESKINIRQLESHLTYYFTTLFNNIIYIASNTGQQTTIENILNGIDAKNDFLINQIKSGNTTYELLFE